MQVSALGADKYVVHSTATDGSPVNINDGSTTYTVGTLTDTQYLQVSGSTITSAAVDLTNVDAELLDSLDSTQFLRSDANDSASGNYTWTGTNDFQDDVTITSAHLTVTSGNVDVNSGDVYIDSGS